MNEIIVNITERREIPSSKWTLFIAELKYPIVTNISPKVFRKNYPKKEMLISELQKRFKTIDFEKDTVLFANKRINSIDEII